MYRKAVFRRQRLYEGLVAICLVATNAVMHMSDGEHQAEFFLTCQQRTKQRHRIRAAGDGNGDALAGPEQLFVEMDDWRSMH